MSKFARRSTVYRAATEVSGQDHLFRTSTATSKKTIAASQAATRFSPRQEANGIARIHAAKKAQTIVCAAFIALRGADRAAVGVCSFMTIMPSGSCMDGLRLGELIR